MSVVIFIIILALLILVHEFGHFIVAKKAGIRVDEFAIGFPPKLFSWQKGETTYSLNLIPFGGYVKIYGETPEEFEEEKVDYSRSMVSKSKWVQALVLVGGVTFNFLFGWLLLSVGFTQGLPVSTSVSDDPSVQQSAVLTVIGLAPDSPADQLGLSVGDQIVEASLAGDGSETLVKPTPEELAGLIENSEGQEILLEYRRGGEISKALITPESQDGDLRIGISMDEVGIMKLPFHKAIFTGFEHTVDMTVAITIALGQLIVDAFVGEAVTENLVGPVGIAGLVGDASDLGFVYLLTFTALISIHLAVINLFPFPALDGGRLLFLLIEAIKGSPIKPKIANTLNLVGFSLLILLMIFITYKDVARLVA